MSLDAWVKRRIGRLAILYALRDGKAVPCPWWQGHTAPMHERGLLQKSTRVHRGWEITPHGLALLQRIEQNGGGT
jgi:hypothetical protein